MSIELQQSKVKIGDTVCVNPLSSDFAETFAYTSIPAGCVIMPTITQEAYDALRLNHEDTYVVKEFFMNPYQARKENEYAGAPGYLVLIESTSNSAIRYLVEDWVVEKVERDEHEDK